MILAWASSFNMLEALKYFCLNQENQKVFFQFEIIINVSVCSSRFIWIPVLWVYGLYKYLIISVRGTFLYFKILRLKSFPALKGFLYNALLHIIVYSYFEHR